eukprot:CAMPEP_0181305650 /NCGR_PEP_ID=MMETSP1101-20121128/9851_1 /TAXON_ID=46948 /ORGANISM="Rhodomonas abbreviata, Strain Caron Lab Isolate" /LENGTH=427 /DNA_ID=CAMNT_0023411597 /DNA_START=255 /DNA_END=1538 /DNA_ORIENTATION=+
MSVHGQSVDCDNLLTFFKETSVKGEWHNHTGWSDPITYPDCCVWYGIQCYPSNSPEQSRVMSIDLQSNGLYGDLSSILSKLDFLSEIVLTDNVLRGRMVGTGVQNIVGQYRCNDAAQLRYFALASICTLDCRGTCELVGGLETLKLDSNQLTDEIPVEISRLYKTLQLLDFSSNQLTGEIPETVGCLTQLKQLNLGFNQLSGPIPPTIGRLTNLRFLNLGFNHLSGAIPRQIINLARMEQLDLSVNGFHGTVPSDLGVLVSPPPLPCDRPGGTCFGETMANMSLADHGTCERGQLTMWYVMGYKQPCNEAARGSDPYWCASCAPPYPSRAHLPKDQASQPLVTIDCSSGLPPAAATPNMLEDYPTYPWAPAMPPIIEVRVPGPSLRLMILSRCTWTPSVYAVHAGERTLPDSDATSPPAEPIVPTGR